MNARAEFRERLLGELRQVQRARRQTGDAAARDNFEVVQRELDLSGVVLDVDEQRTLLWLAGGELHTLAHVVALIVLPHLGGE